MKSGQILPRSAKGTIQLVNVEKVLLTAPDWLYYEEPSLTLKLVADGPLLGRGQYSSYIPLKSKVSKQHKSRSLISADFPPIHAVSIVRCLLKCTELPL